MRLKSIKLAGFKSFVDSTLVTFPTNMSAVVGPNGCGKSNIIDAVRWVMGESSAKHLRGESMTDVIFNGSSTRQPIGQASIELLFDNAEGKVAGEYAKFSEISIRRKVTREGVSQYYINGSKCRRRDVTDIFLGTGLGPRSYAIIEQGMISRIIESKPEDLRIYLEEAAGISKYKERRRETENRMKRTTENMERLTDIREELDKQLQHLKRQANAAERYAEFKQEERYKTAQLSSLNWQKLNQQESVKQDAIREIEIAIEKGVYGKTASESLIENARLEHQDLQESFNKVQARYYESGAEIAKIEQQIKFQKERAQQAQQELSRLEEETEYAQEKLDKDSLEFERVSETIEEIRPKFEIASEQAESVSLRLEDAESGMQQWQNDWDAFNQQSANAQQRAQVEQNKIQQAEARIRQLNERLRRLEEERQALQEQMVEDEGEELRLELASVEERLAEAEAGYEESNLQITELKAEIDEAQQNLGQARSSLSEKNAIMASLKTLQEAAMRDANHDLLGDFFEQGRFENQSMIDALSVDSGWEKAIEHVLHDWLQGHIVGDLGEILKADREGLPSFSVIGDIENQEFENPVNGSLSTVVEGGAFFNPVLNKIKLCDDLSDALSQRSQLAADESIILSDGTWIGKVWVKHFSPDETKTGVLNRKEQIETTESEIAVLSSQLESGQKALSDTKSKLDIAESKARELQVQLNSSQRDRGELASRLSAINAKRDQFELRLKRSQDDIEEATESVQEETAALEISRENWQLAMEELNANTDKKETLIANKEGLQKKLEDARLSTRESQTRAHELQLELQAQQNTINLLQQQIARYKETIQRAFERKQQLESVSQPDENSIEDLQLQLEGMLESRINEEHKLVEAREKLEKVAIQLRDAESDRTKHEMKVQEFRSQLESLRMENQALVINKKALVEKIEQDDFVLTEMLESLTEEDSEDSLSKHIETLGNRIQRLGPINLAAIDEFKAQSERKTYLDAQHEDLQEALDTLANAIRKIDRETRARFKETYDQVNSGIQQIFPKMFGGGKAHLELTEDDLLETGVQIIAQPPGKKNATIHLLSGGEKALTAISLIFSIFQLNPAPFCMLDEVDAPLDDANVGRFANMVKEMSKTVQFIYISHNKVAMEMADQLMGVTMNEPGVSRLVSVDVDEATALVEA